MNYILYDKITGEILQTGVCTPADFSSQLQVAGRALLEGIANDMTQYIVTGTVADKVENPATIDKTEISADGIDVATILDLPDFTTIWFDGTEYVVTDGIFEFTIDTPGEYVIRCESFPYLDKEFTVYAN